MNLGAMMENHNTSFGFAGLKSTEVTSIGTASDLKLNLESGGDNRGSDCQSTTATCPRSSNNSKGLNFWKFRIPWWIVCTLLAVLFLLCGSFVTSTIVANKNHQYDSIGNLPTLPLDVVEQPLPRNVREIRNTPTVRSVLSKNVNRTRTTPPRVESVVNVTRNGTSASQPARTKKVKTLPSNAEAKHPVSLLHEMQLQPEFNITHCTQGQKKVTIQSFKATVNLLQTNSTYGPAYGRSRKQVKRLSAIIALKALYPLLTFNDTVEADANERKRACGDT